MYGKSLIYDWEYTYGLIFVSLGSSLAPADWIIAKNGTAYRPLDLNLSEDAFIDSLNVFRGMGYSLIDPTKAGYTLGIHQWGSFWQIDPSALTNNEYYSYGIVNPYGWLQLCFVRVGRGGWLYCGDGWNLTDDEVAHDLCMILLHAPWNGEWIGDSSWAWNSNSAIYVVNGGKKIVNDTFSFGYSSMPPKSLHIHIIILAYEADKNKYTLIEADVHRIISDFLLSAKARIAG